MEQEEQKNTQHFPMLNFQSIAEDVLLLMHLPICNEKITTNDLIDLLSPTSFIWLGRIDNVINTGGIKIFPEQLERKLTSEIKLPFIISSEKDLELGDRVILVVQTDGNDKTTDYSEAFQKLSPYERPKKMYTLSKFPLTENGKIRRGKIKHIIAGYKPSR